MEWLLPLGALGILAAFFVSGALRATVRATGFDPGKIEISAGRLRMVNPRMTGFGKNSEAYTVTAAHAEHDLDKPHIVYLDTIKADLDRSEGKWMKLTAKKGILNSRKDHLRLFDGLTIVTDDGMRAKLKNADIDLKTQIVTTKEPVEFDLLNGVVYGNAMVLHSESKQVLLSRGVTVTIHKRPGQKAP